MANGIMNKFLRVDLSQKSVKELAVSESILKKYIGGMGLATKIIWENITHLKSKGMDPATMDALSPENPIIVATGPGTGVGGFPSSGRYHIMTMKSPLTGSIGSANAGGNFGAYLKQAGFDGILIQGKSDSPVYLKILDNTVKIEDANDLWGKTVYETTDLLLERHGGDNFKVAVATIGPAGEQLRPMASLMNDYHRAAGRTGIGAVMGSKNLKAIVAGGNQRVEVADKDKFIEIAREKTQKMKDNPVCGEGLPTFGTAVLVNVINGIGSLPTNNWQKAKDENAENISGGTLKEKYLMKNTGCWGCTIGCGRNTSIPSGPYKVDDFDGPEYETIWAFGSDCGVDDLEAIVQANNYCDEYGVDTISMGATVACTMELAEKGYLPKEQWEGLDIRFGNATAMVELTRMACQNVGLGEKLALGSYRLAKMYGHPELSMSCRRLDMPAYDPRGIKGIGLNYATANRGGCHVTGYTIAPEVVGLPEQLDRTTYEGKATWVKTFQDFTAVVNSTVNCLFTTFALGAADYAELLGTVTGWHLTPDSILERGERIYSLQRLIMKEIGADLSDSVPERLEKEPLPGGESKGMLFDLSKMKQEYYNLRGWTAKGIPSDEKIAQLGLDKFEESVVAFE